jgi:hypothetical protein
MTSPLRMRSPRSTMGFWLMQVFWFERRNFSSVVDVGLRGDVVAVDLDHDAVASTDSTTPSCLATVVTPESRATMRSMPVPTSGASVTSSGTACRCMFEPMSARLASSFSRNGMSDAATETSWFGLTSISVDALGGLDRTKSPALRALTRSVTKRPFSSTCAFAWAMRWPSSSSAL